MSLAHSVEDCFQRAAVSVGGDLDEENLHLAKLRVAHFVRSLRQPERPPGYERERKRFTDRFGPNAERAGLGKFHRQNAIRENNLEILIETGGELGAFNFIELQHKESDE
jgi:hypothetical protein